jgi:hypothetical protein
MPLVYFLCEPFKFQSLLTVGGETLNTATTSCSKGEPLLPLLAIHLLRLLDLMLPLFLHCLVDHARR